MYEKNFLFVIDRKIHLWTGRTHRRAICVRKALTLEPTNQQLDPVSLQEVCRHAVKLKSKKVAICLPDGVYKVGFSMVPASFSSGDISCCIASIASDFFSTRKDNIWLDYFFIREIRDKEIKNREKKNKIIWVAVPGDRLKTYRLLTNKINLCAARITVSPVVIANALCILSNIMVHGKTRNWLVVSEKNLIFVDIRNGRVQNIFLDCLPDGVCFNSSISLQLLHEIIKVNGLALAAESGPDTVKERYVVGKKIWFQHGRDTGCLRVDEATYTFLEKNIFVAHKFRPELYLYRTLCYLLTFGLSML